MNIPSSASGTWRWRWWAAARRFNFTILAAVLMVALSGSAVVTAALAALLSCRYDPLPATRRAGGLTAAGTCAPSSPPASLPSGATKYQDGDGYAHQMLVLGEQLCRWIVVGHARRRSRC
jgi:hypothetical protein